MFYPPILPLLQFLADHPDGVSRGQALEFLSRLPPEGVERALEWALKAGVVEERGGFLTPQPPLLPLARKMERLTTQVNRQVQDQEQVREQTLGLVRMILGNPPGM